MKVFKIVALCLGIITLLALIGHKAYISSAEQQYTIVAAEEWDDDDTIYYTPS